MGAVIPAFLIGDIQGITKGHPKITLDNKFLPFRVISST
jgi:hypothetical protein